MTFAARSLSVLSYANGFTLWHYTTTDTLSNIMGDNYYNGASDMLRKGDLIMTNCDTGGTPVNTQFWVTKVDGDIVTVSQ